MGGTFFLGRVVVVVGLAAVSETSFLFLKYLKPGMTQMITMKVSIIVH